MKIEVLFPEICNLYGEEANVRYLKECLPQADILETSLQTRPRFLDEEVDLVYMGTTTESGQQLAMDQLRLHRSKVLSRIEGGVRFLVTGNAMELFAHSIEEDGEEVLKGLGLFPGIVRRSSVDRFNSLFLGTFSPDQNIKWEKDGDYDAAESNVKVEIAGTDYVPGSGKDITIVGFKSQFGHIYCDAGNETLEEVALFRALRGPGMNRNTRGEGIRINNFLASYVIGPLLILNPPFTKWLITDFMGQSLDELAYEEEAMDSYRHRVEEYADPDTGIYYWGGSNQRW